MAEGGATPPPEAVRKGGGVSAAVTIVIAVVTFLAGIGAGFFIFSAPPAKAKLVVGTNAPFPPFEEYNDTLGTFVGFDMDIAKLVADALGRELVIRNFNDFDLLLATVGQGGVDVSMAAITMSGTKGAQRNQTMDFSDPYYSANQGIIVRSGDAFTCGSDQICTQQEVLGHTIGVQSGTTSEGWVDEFITNNQTEEIFRYRDVVDEINALKNSIYQLMIIDEGPARAIVSGSGGQLKFAGTIITNELYGIAVANNDPKGYLPTINSVLQQIKQDGRYDDLLRKWFGGGS